METAEIETTETAETFEPASFGDVLKNSKSKDPVPADREDPFEGEKTTEESPESDGTPELETKKEEKAEGESEKKEESKERDGIFKAYMAEKKKRQEYEERLKALEGTPREPQTYYEDPEKFIEKKVEDVKKTYDDRLIAMSESMAKSAHPDFQEKYSAFEEAASLNPNLIDIAFGSLNPGEEAYQLGKRYLFQKQYGADPDDIVKNVRKAVYDEARREAQADLQKRAKAKQNQPTSLSGARAASGETQSWQPSGWSDVLQKRKR